MSTKDKGQSSSAATGLPHELRQVVDRLYDLPLKSKPALESMIDKYADDIEQAATNRGDLDVNLAHCIANRCLVLLEEEWDKAGENHRRLIQAACFYFVEDEDEVGDLQSVYGFDDDAALVNAVLDQLDRSDLAIHI